MPGKPISTMATSGRVPKIRARPLTPSAAVNTVWPSSSSNEDSPASASSLSSTIAMRRCRRAGKGSSNLTSSGRATAGRRTVIMVPVGLAASPARPPSPIFFAVIVPPCSSTRRRTKVKPTPIPPARRSSDRSPCTKRSKTRGKSSGSIPTPVSSTSRTASSPS